MAFHHNAQLLDPSSGSCHRNAQLLDPIPRYRAVQYGTTLKRFLVGQGAQVTGLGDLRDVSSELLFFDNEEVIFVRLDQSKVPKFPHKHAGPWSRRAHHIRQFLMRNLQFNANAPWVFLAEGAH